MTQSKEEQCPICSKSFPVSQLYKHVNSCLDNQESKNHPVKRHQKTQAESRDPSTEETKHA